MRDKKSVIHIETNKQNGRGLSLLVVTLNVNELTSSQKDGRMDKKMIQPYIAYRRLILDPKTWTGWKLKCGKGYTVKIVTKGEQGWLY